METTHYHENTPSVVRNILEQYRGSATRLRLFFGDTETGEAWPEEYDVIGTIGRSTGSMAVPLLIANSRSLGGGAILDHCIVAIKCGANWLYRHPTFSNGPWSITDSDLPEYSHCVLFKGAVHARFKSLRSAEHYMGFMTGARMCK